MPSRKRRHMASFKGMMSAHAPVVTDARTSGGWMGWMPAKMSPATKAAKPLQRMSSEAVGFMLLSFPSVAIFRSSLDSRGHSVRTRFVCGRQLSVSSLDLLFVDGRIRLGGFEAHGRDHGHSQISHFLSQPVQRGLIHYWAGQ